MVLTDDEEAVDDFADDDLPGHLDEDDFAPPAI